MLSAIEAPPLINQISESHAVNHMHKMSTISHVYCTCIILYIILYIPTVLLVYMYMYNVHVRTYMYIPTVVLVYQYTAMQTCTCTYTCMYQGQQSWSGAPVLPGRRLQPPWPLPVAADTAPATGPLHSLCRTQHMYLWCTASGVHEGQRPAFDPHGLLVVYISGGLMCQVWRSIIEVHVYTCMYMYVRGG